MKLFLNQEEENQKIFENKTIFSLPTFKYILINTIKRKAQTYIESVLFNIFVVVNSDGLSLHCKNVVVVLCKNNLPL